MAPVSNSINRTITVNPRPDGSLTISAPVPDWQTLLHATDIGLAAWTRQNTHLIGNRIAGYLVKEYYEKLLSKLVMRSFHARISMKITRAEAAALWLVLSSTATAHQLPGVSMILNRIHQIVQP